MVSAHTIGSTAKSSTKSSRTFTRDIGLMAKGRGLGVSSTPMGAGMKGILIRIKNMARDLLWMRMGMLSWKFFRKINLLAPFPKVILRC
jgi:hypothetical protein